MALTWQQIAEACGTSDRVLRKWRKLPGFPAGKDLENIQHWVALRHGATGEGENLCDAEVARRRRLAQMHQDEQKARQERIKADEMDALLMPRAEVDKRCSRIASVLKTTVLQIAASVSQDVVPYLSDPRDISAITTIFDDRIRAALNLAADQLTHLDQSQ